MPQQYLDDNGNPISAPSPATSGGPVYLDDSGNPVKRPIGASGEWKPTLTQRVAEYMPSPRTAFRVGGGMIGGAVGATGGTVLGTPIGGVGGAGVGGSAGAAGGEALYQLIQRMRGAESPQSGLEAAQEVANAAAQGAVQEALPAAMTTKIPGMLQRGSEEAVARVSRPATEGEKATVRKVAGDAIPNMPVAATEAGVLKGYNANLTTAVRELERAYNAVPANTKFKNGPFLGQLQASRNKLLINGQIPPGAKPQIDAYDEMIQWFKDNPSFSIGDLRKNKQLWDGLVNWYRGSLSREPAKEQAYQEGSNIIRNVVSGVFPKIGEANKQVHTWKTLVDSLGRAEVKGVGRPGQFAVDAGTSVIGGGVGFLMGGAPGAAVGASTVTLIRELVKTPAWQTASIPVRQFAIQALQRGDVQAAVKALTAGGTAGGALAVENVGIQ